MGAVKGPIRNLSVSRIEKAMLCPKHYKLKVIDKVPEMASWVAHGGIVVHEIVEAALKLFGRTGKYPSWQDMDDRFDTVWNNQQLKTEGRDEFIGWKEDPKEPIEKVRTEYRPLVRLAREEALEHYRPWMLDSGPVVEQRIDLELESSLGSFPIIGYIDLLDDTGVLSDWKTTTLNDKGEVSERKTKNWLQAACYSLWAWPIVGEENLRCRKVFLIRGKNPQVRIHNYVVGEKHRKFFTDVAAEVWTMTMRGGFVPNTNTWMCNPKWCAYYAVCRGEIDDQGNPAVQDGEPGGTHVAEGGSPLF